MSFSVFEAIVLLANSLQTDLGISGKKTVKISDPLSTYRNPPRSLFSKKFSNKIIIQN